MMLGHTHHVVQRVVTFHPGHCLFYLLLGIFFFLFHGRARRLCCRAPEGLDLGELDY